MNVIVKTLKTFSCSPSEVKVLIKKYNENLDLNPDESGSRMNEKDETTSASYSRSIESCLGE